MPANRNSLAFYIDGDTSPWHVLTGATRPFSVRIGRGVESDLVVPDHLTPEIRTTVSRLHARLFHRDGTFWVEDLGSNNFTYLDGRIVFAPVKVTFPCALRLGRLALSIKLEHIADRTQQLTAPKQDESHQRFIRETVTAGAMGTHRRHLLGEVRDRLDWGGALLDIADLIGTALRAELIEQRLEALFAVHLGAEQVSIHYDLSRDTIPDLMCEWAIERSAVEAEVAALQSCETGTYVHQVELKRPPALIWAVTIPGVSTETCCLVAAHYAQEPPPRAQSEEATALVRIAISIVRPLLAALREVDVLRASVHESVPHAPSQDILTYCNKAGVWGSDPAFQQALYLSEQAAMRYLRHKVDDPRLPCLFFQGESGTGKSALARLIHDLSDHADGRYEELNCATVPDALADSELFGYEKGAFSGANTDKPGLFELVDGGTLFLDEIGKTSTDFQSKLLKVLDVGQYRRLGSTFSRTTKCYVILAASEDPERLCEAGTLLPELWYRIGAYVITLPPLRDRNQDLGILIDKKIAQLNQHDQDSAPKTLSTEVRGLLLAHTWPGNVRELMQAIEVAHALSPQHSTKIEYSTLPIPLLRRLNATKPRPVAVTDINLAQTWDEAIQDLERLYLVTMIAACDGNLSETARRSGKALETIRSRLKHLRLWLRSDADSRSDEAVARLRGAARDHWNFILDG